MNYLRSKIAAKFIVFLAVVLVVFWSIPCSTVFGETQEGLELQGSPGSEQSEAVEETEETVTEATEETTTETTTGETGETATETTEEVVTEETATEETTKVITGTTAVDIVDAEAIPLPDTTPPVITVIGNSPVMVELGSEYTDAGATAVDDVDGDLTGSVKIVSAVNTAVPGSYKVTYNVSDKAGNAAVEVTRIVDVLGKPTITTDKDDYSPGDIVVVAGSRWLPGETVKLDFAVLPLQLTLTYFAVADDKGNIYNNEYIIFEHHLGQEIILTATGQTSGMSTMTVFTDSLQIDLGPIAIAIIDNPQIGSVTVGAQSPVVVYPASNARYTITINRGTGKGSFYADLSVITPLPDGCAASFKSSHIYFSSSRSSATTTLTISTTSGTTPAGITSFTVRAEVSDTSTDCAKGDGTLTVGGIGSVTAKSQSPNPVYTPGSATYTVTVNRSGIGPFSVDLSIITELPDGCTYSFSPSTVSFSPGDTSKTSTLTINTSGSTPEGSTSFTIKAVNSDNPDDYKTRSRTLTVATYTSTPQIGAVTVGNQSPVVVYPANNARYTITVTRGTGKGSFYADLSVITPLPDGCTASFKNSHIYFSSSRKSATTTLIISTTSGTTLAGTTSFTVQAVNSVYSGDFATGDGALTVGGVGSVTAGSQSPNPVYASNSAVYTVTVNRSGLGSFSVDLSVTTVLPDGCTYSFNPSTVSFSPGDTSKTSTLTVNTSGSTPEGKTSFTIRATNSGNPDDYKSRNRTLVVRTDTTIPTVTLKEYLPDPASDNTPTYSGSAADTRTNIVDVEYRVDDGSWTDVDTFTPDKNVNFTFTTSALTGGAHTIYVRAYDAAGNISPTASDTLTVDPITTSLSVLPASGTYGGTVDLSATLIPAVSGEVINFTLNGNGVGDAITDASGVATLDNVSLSGIDAGLYPTGVDASFAGDSGYSASSGSNSLTVDTAPLTVTADNASRIYGNPNPAFGVTYLGFVAGDDGTNLTGTLEVTTTATEASPVGIYPITPAGLNSTNYSITFVEGSLTVTPAPLTVTANNASKVYGSPNPLFSGTIAGIVNSDNIGAIYDSTASINSPVGTYPIFPSLSDPDGKLVNYTVTIFNGTLTITAAAVTESTNTTSGGNSDSKSENNIVVAGEEEIQNMTVAELSTAPDNDFDEVFYNYATADNYKPLDTVSFVTQDDEVEPNIEVAGISGFETVEVPLFTRLSPIILILGIGFAAAGLIAFFVHVLRIMKLKKVQL